MVWLLRVDFHLLKWWKILFKHANIFIDDLKGTKSSETEKPNAIVETLIESSGSTDTATVDYLDSLSEVFDGDIKR